MFFGHKFRTTNGRWSIKDSKDVNFRLVSFKTKKQIIASWGWSRQPGPKMPKHTSIVTSPIKNLNPKLLNYFKIGTTRLSASLEDFNSSLALAAGELWPNMCLA